MPSSVAGLQHLLSSIPTFLKLLKPPWKHCLEITRASHLLAPPLLLQLRLLTKSQIRLQELRESNCGKLYRCQYRPLWINERHLNRISASGTSRGWLSGFPELEPLVFSLILQARESAALSEIHFYHLNRHPASAYTCSKCLWCRHQWISYHFPLVEGEEVLSLALAPQPSPLAFQEVEAAFRLEPRWQLSWLLFLIVAMAKSN